MAVDPARSVSSSDAKRPRADSGPSVYNGPIQRKPRHICDLGSREHVQILSFKARDGAVDDFELRIQDIADRLYDLKSGITDVRVAHPCVGDVSFIVTFLTSTERDAFNAAGGMCEEICGALAGHAQGGAPVFRSVGSKMPQARGGPSHERQCAVATPLNRPCLHY